MKNGNLLSLVSFWFLGYLQLISEFPIVSIAPATTPADTPGFELFTLRLNLDAKFESICKDPTINYMISMKLLFDFQLELISINRLTFYSFPDGRTFRQSLGCMFFDKFIGF